MKIRIDDSPYARLDAYFDLVADKIKETNGKGGKTLVHCVAGVSRSASLVCAYLIKYDAMSLRQAYQYVKAVRPIIRPNVGFWKQLIDYEKRLRGNSTVQMVPARYGCQDVPDVYMDEVRVLKPPSSTVSSLLLARSTMSTNETGSTDHSDRLSSRLAALSLANGSSTITSRSTHSSPLSNRMGSRYYRRGASSFGATGRTVGSPFKAKNKGNFFSSLYNSTTEFMFPSL